MAEKCICETGEPKSMGDSMYATTIQVDNEFGAWSVSVMHPDNHGPCSYEPIRFCPLCGRSLDG